MNGILQRFAVRVRDEILPLRHQFDIEHGTDTSGRVSKVRMLRWNVVGYQGLHPEAFQDAMAHLPAEPGSHTFIDIGCGKGRVLIMAWEHGFRNVVGVEYSASLTRIAKKNLKLLQIHAEVVRADGESYQFDGVANPIVLFMYNPFGSNIFATVLRNALDHNLSGYLVFVEPTVRHRLEADRLCFQTEHISERLAIWTIRP